MKKSKRTRKAATNFRYRLWETLPAKVKVENITPVPLVLLVIQA